MSLFLDSSDALILREKSPGVGAFVLGISVCAHLEVSDLGMLTVLISWD